MAQNEMVETILFAFFALICVFALGVIGASFGGVAEQIANQGITAIAFLVAFVLIIPPIGFIIWLISKAKEF